MTASEPENIAAGGKTYQLSGDFRGAIVNIESTFVNSAAVQDIEGLAPEPGDPPYKGLQHFDEADADHFLGREALTARLAGRLETARFLAVIGASGSGKSSVVRAGLIPALRRGQPLADGALPPTGSDNWLIRVLTPTAHPLDALAAALRPGDEPAAVAALRDELAASSAALAGFRPPTADDRPQTTDEEPPTTDDGRPPSAVGRPLLLVVDQFEEIFSLTRQEAERRAFVDNLVTAAASGAPIRVVIVLRADFYAHCAQYDGLRELVAANQEYIGAMTREELFRVIVLPAARGDWKLQEGLVELMLDDAGDEPGALPLLSHALLETWQRRRGRTMTLSGYKEAGGVRGAIAKTAETVFRRRLTPEQQPIARMIFVRLTELGESKLDTPDTRRRAQFSELITRATDAPLLEAVLSILVDSRLVMTDIIPPGETKVVEVCHEALIREWPTLRDWLNQDREALIRHRQLTGDVNDWLSLDRDPGALYRGARLEQTLAWAADPPDPLSVDEQAFLEASRAAAAEEARRAERLARSTRNQRALLGVAALLLVGIVVAVLYSLGVFNPPVEQMTGDFNVAVAEFAVLDEAGRLTNDDHDGGRRIAARVGAGLLSEVGQDVSVWYDGEGSEGHVPVGVVGEGFEGAADPAAVAEALNADLIVYGVVAPAGAFSDLAVRVYARPQFDADFGSVVGNYDLVERIPVFDPDQPREEVWQRLDPVARAAGLLMLGLRQELLGNQPGALAFFERAAELTPESDVAHYFVGQENFYLSQTGEGDTSGYRAAAATAFERALALDPENARALIGQAGLHFMAAQEKVAGLAAAGATDPAAYEPARGEAQAAWDGYGRAIALDAESQRFGVPVGSIGRYGQALSLRLLGEIAFRAGDAAGAEQLIDQAVTLLEGELGRLDTANEPRLAAQYNEALGSVYEWRGYLRELRGDSTAADAYRQALDAYERCRRQGEAFPFDTFMAQEIVQEICVPGIESVQQRINGGGS